MTPARETELRTQRAATEAARKVKRRPRPGRCRDKARETLAAIERIKEARR